MLVRCNNNEIKGIVNYIDKEYYACIYLYLDLLKYGCEDENVKVWLQKNNNNITSVILKYYSGMHVFSKKNDFDVEEIVRLINDEKPSMVCGEKRIIEGIYNSIKTKEYKIETGFVRELKQIKYEDYSNVKSAEKEDFYDIAKLIYEDEDLGSSYKLEELEKQMYERNIQKYTRNYVIHEDGKVVAHAATGAENDKIAMLAYVITDPNHRGKGLAIKVCSKVCSELKQEGKQIFLINYSNESTKLYDKLGFEPKCEWGKLFLDLKKEEVKK